MVKEGPPQPAPPPKQPYPAERARGGEIILTTPLRRWVFISGLAGAVALVLVLGLLRWTGTTRRGKQAVDPIRSLRRLP